MGDRRGKTNRRTLGAVVVLVGIAAICGPTLAASASGQQRQGLVAFSRYRLSDNPVWKEIWVVKPDGSGLRRVVRTPNNYLDDDPTWSGDGSKLLFTRCAPRNGSICGGPSTVWAVDWNGSGLRLLTPHCKSPTLTPSLSCPQDGQASYSPNGRQIGVLRFVGLPAIGIADSRLHHVQLIFPFGENKYAPDEDSLVWSPDGRQLAFAVHNTRKNHQLPSEGRAIYLMNRDGSGLRRVTPWKVAAGGIGELAWSPDGSRILFRSVRIENRDPDLSTGDIYSIRPNGQGLRQLTHFPPGTGVQLGSYSPDGQRIVFSTTRGAVRNPPVQFPDLFTMNTDGSHIHRVLGTRNWDGTADWGR
jgi:TolB protein